VSTPITAAELAVIDQHMASSARKLTAILHSYRRNTAQNGSEDDTQALANIALALEIGMNCEDVIGIVLAATRKIARLERQLT
jgi:hypothetical protein